MSRSIVLRGIEVVLGANLTEFEKGLKRAQGTLQRFARQSQSIGNALLPLTGALTGIGAVSLKASIDFESAFAGVRKTVEATEGQFKQLEKQFRSMAQEMPASAVAIADVAAAGGAMGIAAQDLEEFSKVMIKVDEATNLTAEEAAGSFARLTAVMKTSVSEYEAVGSALVALGNNFSATESDIIGMTDRMLGAASIVGLTEDQTLALATALSSVGVEAEAGGTAMQKLLLSMQTVVQSGGSDLKIFDQIVRSTGKSFSELFNDSPVKAIQGFLDGLAQVQASGGNVNKILGALGYTEVRLRNAILLGTSAHKDFARAIDIAAQARRDATALDKEYQARLNTLGAQLKITKNNITELAIEIGDILAPHVRTVSDNIRDLTQQVNLASPQTKDFATAITAVGTAALAAGLAIPRLAAVLAVLITPLGAISAALVGVGVAAYTFRTDLLKEFELVKKGAKNLATIVVREVNLIKLGLQNLPGAFAKGGSLKERLDEDRKAAQAATKSVGDFSDQMSKASDALSEVGGMSEGIMSVGEMYDYSAEAASGAADGAGKFNVNLGETDKAAKKTKDALADLNEQLIDFKRESIDKALQNSFENAINSGDFDSANAITGQIAESTKFGVLEGLDEAVRGTPAAQELADLTAAAQVAEYQGRIQDAAIQMHETAVAGWVRAFENGITGVTFNLEDALKQVAVGFAAEIAASLTQGLDLGLDFSSPQGFGTSLAQKLTGSLLNGVSGSGSILEGLKMSVLGLEGPMTQAQSSFVGLASSAGIAAAALGGIASAFMSFKAIQKGDPLQAGIFGGIAGGAFPGITAAIAAGFNGGGKKDPEANAREKFTDELGKLIKEIKGITIQGSDGNFLLDSIDILGGRDKFDPGKGGFDFLNSLSAEAQNTFKGLGAAFKDMFDLADADATQLGAILSENLLGNIDNARLLVRQLGLDFDQLKEGILATANAGEISWLEFNTEVAGLSEAFEPGLAALADVGTALESLRNSGARGFGSINDLRNLAQEAIEAGGTALSDLTEILMANGATAEEAQQIITAAAGRGVEDLQALAGASDDVAGSIVGDLDAMGFGFKELSGDVQTVHDLMQQIDQFEFQTKTVKINVEVNDPSGALPESGTTVETPGVSSDSERSATRRTSNKSRSVRSSSAANIHIDARGADPSVEPRLRQMISSLERSLSDRVLNTVVDAQRRGYL